MDQNNHPVMTDLDCMVSTESMQIMKAMIPWLPSGSQKLISCFVKLTELRNTISVFDGRPPELSVCAAAQAGHSPADMLNGIRNYCSDKTRQRLDECMNMIVMIQMMEVMQENISEEGETDGTAHRRPVDE